MGHSRVEWVGAKSATDVRAAMTLHRLMMQVDQEGGGFLAPSCKS